MKGPCDGTPLVIAIDALTFFLCTAVLLLVHVPSPTRSDLTTGGRIEQSLWADVREGAIYATVALDPGSVKMRTTKILSGRGNACTSYLGGRQRAVMPALASRLS
jgi:hypothetical protein